MTLYSIAFSLFILMDALGNVPIFIALLKDTKSDRRTKIIIREMLIALGVMIAFFFLGNIVLSALNVSPETVMVSGGIILFLIALKMIFPGAKDNHYGRDKDPFIVPLAIPLVAGPGVLASIMLYAKQNISATTVLTAVFIAWLLSTIILASSSLLQKWLGWRVLTACERLMGLILTLIAVEMFLEGIKACIQR